MARYSDVTYLVAETERKAPRVVHFDRLKKYAGEKNPPWMARYQLRQAVGEEPHDDDSSSGEEPDSD